MSNGRIVGLVVWCSLYPLCNWLAVGARAAESPAVVARSLLEKNKEAVVWVSAVARMTFQSGDSTPLPVNIPDREQEFEANATVLDSTGLTVTALSALDPTREITGREINTSSGRVTLEASAVLKEARIIMADGTEVPADVVMKDVDLDLVFLKPKPESKETKQVAFKPIDLKLQSTAEVSDEVVSLSRSDEVLNRQPAVHRGQVVCVTRKPRVFYRVTGANPGCPTFALDGKVLGIAVNRIMKDKNPVTVVLPAQDVMEIAEQAREAKAPPTADTNQKEKAQNSGSVQKN
ncbi:MAG: hypothetical protein N3G20_00650 [Verrucomicrobiae bacterium]|nr:hypothetical protein [Verrucomicrobiae bacterium]